MTSLKTSLAVAAFTFAAANALPAQKLTAHRQFLSVEPYYASTMLDLGKNVDREMYSAYGARLWINLAPFSGPATNLLGRSTIALFATYQPEQRDQGFNVVYYGGEISHHFIDVPFAGFFDPFFLLGVGDQRTNVFAQGDNGVSHRWAFAPGFGLRMPLPNRLQLRLDGRDILTFPEDAAGKRRTSQSFQFTVGAGLTF